MFKAFLNMYKVSFNMDANTLITVLAKLPFFKKKITDDTYANKNIAFGVIATCFRVIFEVAVKVAFVAVFMFLPQILFAKYMSAGLAGFGLENCFVYFGIILCGLCGSTVRSEIFHNNEYSYLMLKIYRVNPLNFFRFKMLRKSVLEMVAFSVAFSVLGMNVAKSFYLALVIILARYVGETLNIYIFRITGKSLMDLRGISVFVMLSALIVAYFVPYIRGYVPAAYNLVFSTTWLPVILVAGSIFIYYVWNYKSYSKIAVRIYTLADLMNMNDEEGFRLKEKYTDVVTQTEFDQDESDEEWKADNHSEKFFFENKKLIVNGIIFRVLMIFAVIIAAVVAASMGNEDLVYKVISYSLPVLVFIMYVMSRGKNLCKELFYSCDKQLMKKGHYQNSEKVFRSYITVLRDMILIDLVPAGFLVFAYVVAAFLAGGETKVITIVSVCVGILLLSVFFSNYNVFMYYMCMPFSSNEDEISKSKGAIIYHVINGLMYLVCYACIFIEATALHFMLGVALVSALFLSISATFVSKLAVKTFKIKDMS